MSQQPVNPKRGTSEVELSPPTADTIKQIQQLIGVAWTDWDEPEMKAPTLAFLSSIGASTPDENLSKAQAHQLISEHWGNGAYLEEFSNVLVAWAEGDFHATDFIPSAPTDAGAESSDEVDIIAELPRANGQQIAICVGHTVSGNGSGAQNKYARIKDEHKWNEEIAIQVRDILIRQGASPRIYYRTDGSYSTFIAKQSREMRQLQPDCKCALELHYNAAANPQAKGCEFLCFSNSGVSLARELVSAYKEQFADMKLRRDEGVYKISSGNGVGWLKTVPPPAVIAEPFFSSNEKEMLFFDSNKEALALAYAKGLLKFVAR